MTRAMSAFRAWMSLQLSTEAAVTSAVASTLGNIFGNDLGDPPAEDIVNPAGSSGGHGETDGLGLGLRGDCEEENENRCDEDP